MKALIRALAGVEARRVADSLWQQPNEWKADPRLVSYKVHRLRHSSGMTVWVGNDAYGIEVLAPNGRSIWGGVTNASCVGLSAGHRLIRRAADDWIATYAPDKTPRIADLISLSAAA